MKNFLPLRGSIKPQARVFPADRHTFNTILQWLAGFIQLTEEEQKDAGIYLGHQHAG